jgi:chromosome segregation ATPase
MVGAGLLLPASGANAAGGSSATTAKKKLAKLNSQVDQLANKYNKAKTQLDAAKKRLATLNNEIATEKPQYQNLRVRVAQMATTPPSSPPRTPARRWRTCRPSPNSPRTEARR